MSYFITKYALTKGIIEVSESDFHSPKDGRIYGKLSTHHLPQGFPASDWTYNLASAIEQANAKRDAKVASLKKIIAKLEKLDFTKGGAK